MTDDDSAIGTVREGELGVLFVEGSLDQRSIVAVRDSARLVVERKLDEIPVVIMDFSGVMRADSTAISFALYWMRRAKAKNGTVVLRNLPEQMLALARTSRMEQYFHG